MIVVGCGKAKLARSAPAGELYTGSLFRAAKRYALATESRWVIASAKHGVVWPFELVEPYEQELASSGLGVERWAKACAARLVGQLDAGEKVTVLAGARYSKPLTDELYRLGVASSEPLRGLGMGERLRWLSRAASAFEAA